MRDAFIARGHDAWSCDLLPTERPGPHIQGDVLEILGDGWGMMVGHPPCTALTRAGDRWYRNSPLRIEAAGFLRALYDAPIERVGIENPRSWYLNRTWRRPDQVIQPWMFGHNESKATCLWLRNLPPLMATHVGGPYQARVHRAAPGPDRWKERSRTLPGIAAAMAEQWGG